MPELNNQIRTYFEAVAPPVRVDTQSPEPWWQMRPLAAVLAGAAIVAVPILVMWGLFGRTVEPEVTIPPATTVTIPTTTTPPDTTVTAASTPTSTTAPPPATTAPVAAETIGRWLPMADGLWQHPHTIRAWTGTELLVFGAYVSGLDTPSTGMAYDPYSGEWRELASPPEFRSQPAAEWTGSRLLLWGGSTPDGDASVLTDDGFAYDPATDEWTSIPAAPLSPRTYSFHVWTGEEMIVWGGMEDYENQLQIGATDGAAFNPLTNTWRSIAESPLGKRNPGVGVWTGTVMIIGGNGNHTDGDASWAAYNPTTDSWTVLPDPPVRAGNVYSGIWTGSEVVFSDVEHNESGSRSWSELYAFNPTTNQWRQTASPGRLVFQAGAAWTGEYIVYWGETGYPGETPTEMAYHLATDSWVLLEPSPLQDRFSDGNLVALSPNTVLVWGGQDFGVNFFRDGAILVLEED